MRSANEGMSADPVWVALAAAAVGLCLGPLQVMQPIIPFVLALLAGVARSGTA